MKKTTWFASDVKPVHRGIYETKFRTTTNPVRTGFSYWDGKKWRNQFSTPREAKDNAYPGRQDKRWRGLKEPS